MAALGAGWPSCSELRSASFAHLGRFADECQQVAPLVLSSYEERAEQVRAPGGVLWKGVNGERAVEQADADLLKVRAWADSRVDAAQVARRGQEILQAGKDDALEVVCDAQRDGFQVNDDYSVTDTRLAPTRAVYESRLEEATAHSTYIRHRVATLVSNEQQLNAELKAVTASWGKLTFDEAPGAIQLADYTAPRGPVVWCMQPGTSGKYLCHVVYPDLTVDQYWSFTDDSGGYP